MKNAKQEAEERYPEKEITGFDKNGIEVDAEDFYSQELQEAYIKGHESCKKQLTEKLKGLEVLEIETYFENKARKNKYILVSDIENLLK